MKKYLLAIATLLLSLSASAQHGQYVGGDISLLPSYEASKTKYLDADKKQIPDVLTWFKGQGWNSFRVRLFVNPQQKAKDGSTDYAVCQDIEYVKKLGKRIKDAGANFMLDFHYSDTWVDAGSIQAPAVCSSMTVDQKAEWIYNYTKESLQTLKDAGAQPDLVQIGNEIMYGFMGIKVAPYEQSGTDWTGFLKVLGNASKAVREVCPDAKIVVHTDRPANAAYNKYYYGKLVDANIDFDVIGLSYYPFWHGLVPDLKTTLTQLKSNFPTKKVQIVETAYNFQYWPSSDINYDTRTTWANTASGQESFIKDLLAALKNHDNVDGLFYWCPEEAGNGDAANWTTKENIVMEGWLNRGLWDSKTETQASDDANVWGHKLHNNIVTMMPNFLDPTISGIDEASMNSQNSSLTTQWYNISGQRISKPYKQGLYIHNGKKIIVK